MVARYGIELRRHGRALVGRCLFHVDGGRPNLHIWPRTASWWCFRCCIGGDAIRFVELAENVGFLEAVERLQGSQPVQLARPSESRPEAAPSRAEPGDARSPDEALALQAASSLYHQRLLSDADALAYLEHRGIDRAAVMTCHMGYASGLELVPFLRWRSMPISSALRVGLLDSSGREVLAGRIVVPDLQAVLDHVARRADRRPGPGAELLGHAAEVPRPARPEPLLGIDQVREGPSVVVTEGVLDYVVLRPLADFPLWRSWEPTRARPSWASSVRSNGSIWRSIRTIRGLEATLRLMEQLGLRPFP